VSDRIVLQNMVFEGHHGYHAQERATAQPFQVDVELRLDLRPAGIDDDLEKTVDYGKVFAVARRVVESTELQLLEAIAEAIAREVLAGFPPVEEVTVRVRKPKVQLGGRLDYSGVEITRRT
jgi:7,8-dihydroneopterin aldolase/epimerase/oxygenase